jgi:hypothetical protein
MLVWNGTTELVSGWCPLWTHKVAIVNKFIRGNDGSEKWYSVEMHHSGHADNDEIDKRKVNNRKSACCVEL